MIREEGEQPTKKKGKERNQPPTKNSQTANGAVGGVALILKGKG